MNLATALRLLPALLLTFALPAGGAGGGAEGPAPLASYALQFSAQPTSVVAPTPFAVTITVINTMTGLPEAPSPTFTISLGAQGLGGVLQGTTSLLASAATTTFTGLSYTGLGTTSLTADAPGVTGALSSPIVFDQPFPEVAYSVSEFVNSQFALPVAFKSMLNPTQTVSVTNLRLTVHKRAGSGRLKSQAFYIANGTSALLPKISYDAWDTPIIEVATPYSSSRGSIPMAVNLTTGGPTLFVLPSTAQNVTVSVRDGLDKPFAVSDTFSWAVLNGATVVGSGAIGVTNASSFTVPFPSLAAGSYTFVVTPAVGLALLGVPVAMLTDYPGPVVTLRPARVGSPYVETASGIVTGTPTSYSLASGSLPAGLSLDPVTGAITGTPTAAGTSRCVIVGSVAGVNRPMRATLSVFSAGDTEFVAGQNFGFTGATPPYTLTTVDSSVTPTSTFDNGNPTFQIRAHYPTQVATITAPMPLLVLQHGRGFDHIEYNDVLGRVARWGFVCVSGGDYYSFFGLNEPGYGGTQPYETPTQFAEGGMESASGIQERLIRRMIIRNRTVGDVLFGKIDESRIFVAGHSRGGGSVHAGQSRGFNFKLLASPPQIPVTETTGLAGYIGLMPFDLWYFGACQPPSVPAVPGGIGATPYNIPRILRRIPGLIFASELDGDLIYPICDQMIERRSTATCFLTIWGANHNNTGDAHPFSDAATTITALQQRNILVQWMTAFLLRFGYDRLDLEGHLFGSEHAQSSQVGRVAYRDISAPLMVLDAQNGNVAQNTLSLPNVASAGITAALVDPYPLLGSFGNAASRSVRLVFTTTGAGKTFRTTVSSTGLDVQAKKRLVFEIRQSGTTGFNWISIDARLTDINGGTALVNVYNHVPNPDTSAFLPIYPIAGHSTNRPLNRFLQVEVPLASFAGVDLSQLASITFEFNNASTTSNILLDDVRIE